VGGWLLRVLYERGGGRLWGFSCFWESGRGGGDCFDCWREVRSEESGDAV